MLNTEVILLVTCLTLATAIRVDYGTKGGPIVPATPTTSKPPQQPFRDPAPVWEDQNNDIPNPNPYQYILPPPSRPRPLTNNYKTSTRLLPNSQTSREYVIGKVISANDINSLYSPTTGSLSPQYIPNFGFKYNAIVPSHPKKYYTKSSEGYYNEKYSKLNGKYNPKSKKYKAYEKVKYVPHVYFSNAIELPTLSLEQQLPLLQTPQPFRLPEVVRTVPSPTYRISTPKVIYSKDDMDGLSKNYETHETTPSHESNKTRR